ncbi:transposase [Nocardia abscessus]|uniref:transposase n=1 Tax=Nocardia abscessus TaxID=120957 RepID=UPI0024553C48|nr:transposase [Nocardia abscessus]
MRRAGADEHEIGVEDAVPVVAPPRARTRVGVRPGRGAGIESVSVGGRADLTDAQWARLEPLLPRGKKAGRPPKWTKRQLIDGIRWRTRAGGRRAGPADH